MSSACDYKKVCDAVAAASAASTTTANSSTDRIEWSRTTILGFIEDYRRQRVLWDPNTKGYHIKQTKYEALKALGQKYGTEIRSIRSKIKSLRSSFHREHGKVINGRRKGIQYQPMWFAYEAIRFILDGEARSVGGGERTRNHEAAIERAAAIAGGETESGAEEAEEKFSTTNDDGETAAAAEAAAATTTAVVANGRGGGGDGESAADYLLGAAAAAAVLDGLRATDELKVEVATATKLLAATTTSASKAAAAAATATNNINHNNNNHDDGDDVDNSDADDADDDNNAVDDNDFVARVAAAAAVMAAAAGRSASMQTATSTAAAAAAAAAMVTRTTADFDGDSQNYCNISAEDVKTEIIESDFPTSAMVEIPRHISTPSPLNYCKAQTIEQTNTSRKRKTPMDRYNDEHSPTPSKRQQQQHQHDHQQHQHPQSSQQHSNFHAHNRGRADLSTASCSSNTAANKSSSNAPQSDEYGVFGEYVAITIRKLKTSKAKIVIKHLINNLLYEAELGKYDHGIPASKEPPQLYKM